MSRRVLLVRHPPVAESLRGVCYGSSDVPLADAPARIREVASALTSLGPISHIFHSGLSRCAVVADALAALSCVAPVADARLRERCFGAWELRRWDDIYAETGDVMMGMVTTPGAWCPPGGEATFELRDRVLGWHADLPTNGVIMAITHGGPIAGLVGTLRGAPACDWPGMIPPPGGVVALDDVPRSAADSSFGRW